MSTPTKILLAIPALACACVGPGLLTDGSSVSIGSYRRGALRKAAHLPRRGEGYVVPDRWLERDRSYGTDELVGLLVRASRRVQRQHGQALLGIGDLSPRAGGPTPEHLSHHSGRDVDLIFYGVDAQDKDVAPQEMVVYERSGASSQPATLPDAKSSDGETTTALTATAAPDPAALAPKTPPRPTRFDAARNWALIKALITDSETAVQWIFIGRPLIRLVLEHARKIKEPRWLIARAAGVLHQPGDAQNHMDHAHVRVYCARSDRQMGCRDRGPPRWLKKTIRYIDLPPRAARLPLALRALKLPLRLPQL